MPIHKTEALVLRRFDFRETSLIVHFLTRDYGKMHGIIKGIRTDPRKFASTLELFSHNEIVFYRNRSSSLHLVSQADIKNNFSANRADMHKATVAALMMEFMAAVCQEEDKNEEIFDLALACLRELQSTRHIEKITSIFKIKALGLSGFQPHLASCVCCAADASMVSKFSLALGGLVCPGCAPRDTGARQVFRGTIASILHIQKNSFAHTLNLGLNPVIKKELELLLNSFIHFHLEKELKSQKVLARLNEGLPEVSFSELAEAT